MGPGFTSSNLNSENVLGRRSGQCETYLFDMAIDIIWLRYLKTANQLSSSQLVKTLTRTNKGKVEVWKTSLAVIITSQGDVVVE